MFSMSWRLCLLSLEPWKAISYQTLHTLTVLCYTCTIFMHSPTGLIFINQSHLLCHVAGGLGLTAILSGKAEPYRSWAAHLASFGAQAALIADSPYYKLLIGRVLGYKEENIRYHIQVCR